LVDPNIHWRQKCQKQIIRRSKALVLIELYLNKFCRQFYSNCLQRSCWEAGKTAAFAKRPHRSEHPFWQGCVNPAVTLSARSLLVARNQPVGGT
jgi:hypothetical protein